MTTGSVILGVFFGGSTETDASYRFHALVREQLGGFYYATGASAILGTAYSGGYKSLLPEPPKIRAGNPERSVDFVLHTQCKPLEVKRARPDFWIEGVEGAYVVRHNYGTFKFFEEKQAIRMTRTKLGDGEYGYNLTTDLVDWEWGFALKNKKGDWWYEIGEHSKRTPLAGQRCTQMYYPYFNRMITAEKEPVGEYLFSSCDSHCPSDYKDSAFCTLPLTAELFADGGRTRLGKSEDARLIDVHSAMMYSLDTDIIDPGARAVTWRDTEFDNTKDRVQWLVGVIDYGDSGQFGPDGGTDKIKIVKFQVVLDPDGYAYAEGQQNRVWTNPDGKCDKGACYPGMYDVPKLEKSTNAVDVPIADYKLSRLEYLNMELGDAPPTEHSRDFIATENKYLTNDDDGMVVFEPGTWGEDVDIRRVLLTFGSICGGAINYDHCMAAKAFVDPDFTPTEFQKQWVFVVVEGRAQGYFKMCKVVVFNNGDGAVRMKTVIAGYIAMDRDVANINTFDSMFHDIAEAWTNSNSMPVALVPTTTATGYGIGAVNFDLAQEMSASLVGKGCGATEDYKK